MDTHSDYASLLRPTFLAGVLFLAATNRIDVLDSALLRPGRLSRKVLVPLPDEAGRRDILVVHMRGVPMLDESERLMSIDRMAAVTSGELNASELRYQHRRWAKGCSDEEQKRKHARYKAGSA